MKRVILIFLVIAIGGYFVNSYFDKKTKEKAEREKAERIEQSIRMAVSKMVSNFNAIDNWDQKISKGERFRTEKILTIELEELWLKNNPILFIGAIDDISTVDNDNYILRIERSLFSSLKHMFSTELALELRCNKGMVDSFLKEHPKLFSGYGFNNGVAVIAKVNKIKTAFYYGEEGTKEEIRIGEGNCLSILYTGRVHF